MPSPRHLVRLVALACATGATLAAAAPARAAAPPDPTPLIQGGEDFSLAVDCFQLITYGNYTLNVASNARVAQEGTRENPPKVGEVFYLRFFAQVITTNCGQTAILPEVLLPEGVRLAVDPAHPVTWQYPLDFDAPPNGDPAGVVVSPGQFGGTQIASPGPSPWPLRNNGTGNPLLLRFPVVSNRPIAGQPDAPTNPCNDAPCPPRTVATRDLVQVVSAISDGGSRAYLVPNVGLTVADGPAATTAPPPPGSGTKPPGTSAPTRLRLRLPSSIRSAALRRPIVLRLSGPARARLSLRLIAKGRTVARKALIVGGDGQAKVTVRLTGQDAAAIRRSRSTLTVRVSGKSAKGAGLAGVAGRIRVRD